MPTDSNTSFNFPSIVYKNGKPHWDVAQTAAYPVEIERGTSTYPVNIYLSPYTNDELKSVLKEGQSGYKREKNEVEIVREDSAIYTPLFDSHFVKMSKATGTPDAQRAFFDKNSQFKPSIIENSFAALRLNLGDEDETAAAEDILDISMELSGRVKVFQSLYDEATDKIVRIDMEHLYTQPTESQYREYRASRRQKLLRKKSLWTISEQHSTLEQLYDSVIEAVDGLVVNGEACHVDRKSRWLPFIPLWHKLLVVDRVFGELVTKND